MIYLIGIFLSLTGWAQTNRLPDSPVGIEHDIVQFYHSYYVHSHSKNSIAATLKYLYPQRDHADIDVFLNKLPADFVIPISSTQNRLIFGSNPKTQITIDIESAFYSQIKINGYPVNYHAYSGFKNRINYLRRIIDQKSQSPKNVLLKSSPLPWSWIWQQQLLSKESCSWLDSITDSFGVTDCQKDQIMSILAQLVSEKGIPEQCSHIATTKLAQEKQLKCIFQIKPTLLPMFTKLRNLFEYELKTEVNVSCDGARSIYKSRNGPDLKAKDENKIRQSNGDCCKLSDESDRLACLQIINQFNLRGKLAQHLKEVISPNGGAL